MNSDYGVVILYYRHGPDIRNTVQSFLEQTAPPSTVIVVDNGSHDHVCESALSDLAADVKLVKSKENLGYSGGMRTGMSAMPTDLRFIIFATHEVKLAPDAAALLLAAQARTAAAQVGPALTNAQTGDVWSFGGKLTFFGASKHMKTGPRNAIYTTEWIDGCCFLAHNSAATYESFDTRYFLYWEDIHVSRSLSAHGPIVVASGAHASQTTGTTPPYYAARNRILFWRTQGNFFLAAVATLSSLPRLAIRLLRRETKARLVALIHGSVDGWTGNLRTSSPHRAEESKRDEPPEILIVNPLGAALHHYRKEMEDVFRVAGAKVTVVDVPEPSQGHSRAGWVARYMLELLRARRFDGITVSTWPVLGYFDIPLMRLLSGPRSALVLHDPTPLVRAVGYNRVARKIASWTPRPRVVSHSDMASEEIRSWRAPHEMTQLPHPILTENALEANLPEPAGPRPTIRVIGQWKPSRDLVAMTSVASASYTLPPRFEVVGRGWPSVEGWATFDRFIPEEELDALIRDSKVIMVPYSRFYQSGVAIRALENHRPVVGPAASSLSDVYGEHAPTLVRNNDWVGAVREALRMTAAQISQDRERYTRIAVARYSSFIHDMCP